MLGTLVEDFDKFLKCLLLKTYNPCRVADNFLEIFKSTWRLLAFPN